MTDSAPLFLTLAQRIVPLLFLIGCGFVAGRFLKVDRNSVGQLVVYLISPMVFLTSIMQLQWIPGMIFAPIVIFIVCSTVALCFYQLSKRGFSSEERSLIGFGSGNANSGYFGLPVAIALFGESVVGKVILTGSGFILYENTVGYYLLARGKFGPKDALRRLSRLPAIYAIALGLVLNQSGVRLSGFALDFAQYFKGAYSILGMMIIGLGLSEMKRFEFEARTTGMLFLAKFLFWPALVSGLIFADRSTFHFFASEIYPLFLLFSCCPLAANTVAFATILNISPERAAVAVFLSTLFAVLFIPAMMTFLAPLVVGAP
jgi:malate permease and related proteins